MESTRFRRPTGLAALLLATGLSLIPPIGLRAQEVISRSVLLFCGFAPDSAFTETQRRLLVESLIIKLGSASREIRLSQYPFDAPADDGGRDQLARLSGADAWLDVRVEGSMDHAALTFRARDIQKDSDFFTVDIAGSIDPRFRNAFGGLWAPVVRKMLETIHPYRQFNTLSIRGPANASVELEGRPALTLDSVGAASLSLVAPASYPWSLYVPGFRRAGGTWFLEQDSVMEIAPVPRVPVILSAGLEWLAFPSLGIEFSLIPDILGFELSAVGYGLGISPSLPADSFSGLSRDYGLGNLLVGLRWQILAHRWPIQVSVGAGGQVRWLTKGYLRPDPLAPGGWYLLAGASWDLLPELSLFADLVPRFTVSADPRLSQSSLARARQTVSIGNLSLAAGSLIIEPLHFTIGLRWQP